MPIEAEVVIVDAASVDSIPIKFIELNQFKIISKARVIRLAVNLGHQRAIALGLVDVVKQDWADIAVIMDSDGEDRAEDVVRLIRLSLNHPEKIILAKRIRRTESLPFRAGYYLYGVIFKILAGAKLTYGNFSLIPNASLAKLVRNSNIWNHFAAAISRAQLPYLMIPTERGVRYAGKSKMSYTSLVIHGLSAMSVYSDRIAVRLIGASSLAMLCSLILIILVVSIRIFTNLAMPGWASQIVAMLSLASLVSVGFGALLAFITLQSRQGISFIPIIDGSKYIEKVEIWKPKASTNILEKS
jgi:polyisoprenyl-phosphate glycosyltransferase